MFSLPYISFDLQNGNDHHDLQQIIWSKSSSITSIKSYFYQHLLT